MLVWRVSHFIFQLTLKHFGWFKINMLFFVSCSWFYSVWLHAKKQKTPQKTHSRETHCDFQIWLGSQKREWMCHHTQFEGSLTELNGMIWETFITTSNSPCTSHTAKSSCHKATRVQCWPLQTMPVCVYSARQHTHHTLCDVSWTAAAWLALQSDEGSQFGKIVPP